MTVPNTIRSISEMDLCFSKQLEDLLVVSSSTVYEMAKCVMQRCRKHLDGVML